MVSLPPNQEASKVFSLDDKLDPPLEKPALKTMEKNEEVKLSKFKLFAKKLADAGTAIKNKFGKLFEADENDNEDELDNENADDEEEDESNEKEEADEDDGNLFSDEHGNIYYIDKEGHVYKCQEKNGEYHLEEYLGVYRPEENEEESEEKKQKEDEEEDQQQPEKGEKNAKNNSKDLKIRINHEHAEKKSIIEELTFDLESTDDTEEEKNGGNLSAASRVRQQNKVHILKQKGDLIDTKETNINIFKITKEPKKKKSFFQVYFCYCFIGNLKNAKNKFIMNQTSRFVYFEEGIMYVMSQNKKGSEYIIKSVSSLDRLFKVYLENKSPNKVRLAFFNQQYDYQKPPLSKIFTCEKKNEFLISLKNEMHKLNKEMKVEIL